MCISSTNILQHSYALTHSTTNVDIVTLGSMHGDTEWWQGAVSQRKWMEWDGGDVRVHTILVAGGGASRPDAGAAAEEGLSVGLRWVRLLFARLVGVLLLRLLRGLSVGHSNLLLVQSEGMGGQDHLPTPGPRTSLHRHIWHLEEKGRSLTYSSTPTNTIQKHTLTCQTYGQAPYLMTVIAGECPVFLCVHYSP